MSPGVSWVSRLAHVATLAAGVGLIACGGGEETTGATADARPTPDGGEPVCECNPTFGPRGGCCAEGDRCSLRYEGGSRPNTMCLVDGFIPEGDACTVGSGELGTRHDDCVGGTVCFDGRCSPVCALNLDSCVGPDSCVDVPHLFWDRGNVGVCMRACDPLAQNCAQNPEHAYGTGCYVDVFTAGTYCLAAGLGTEDGAAVAGGAACSAFAACEVGYGCLLPDSVADATTNVCAFLCDSDSTGGPTCAEGPGADHACVSLVDFYEGIGSVPPEIGMCVDCDVWTEVAECQ